MSAIRSRMAAWRAGKCWQFDISALTIESVKPFGLGNKEALRCKNMWTLGLALWLFDRGRQPIVDWLKAKFAKDPELAEANIAALNAGHAYGETAELAVPLKQLHLAPAEQAEGLYRTVTGAESISLGLVAGAQLAGLPMFFGGYPITPASAILHHLTRLKEYRRHHLPGGGRDRGHLRARSARPTPDSLASPLRPGPGIALKGEAMGLAIMTELPFDHRELAAWRAFHRPADQDRAIGPLPGRLWPQWRCAARGHCRALPRRCVRLRDRGLPHRHPIYGAGDAADRRLHRQCRRALARAGHGQLRAVPGASSWPKRRRAASSPMRATRSSSARGSSPARPASMHRIGGIEKEVNTGHINYAAANHQAMTEIRRDKVLGIAKGIRQDVSLGNETGKLAVVGWGSTFGPIHQAVKRARAPRA